MISTDTSRRAAVVGAAVAAVAIVAAGVLFAVTRTPHSTVTVDFDRTVSLYEGSKVRILGVDVGTVEKITPRGQNVRVRLTWDADVKVPADVRAVVVSPSVVGDRYVQLTPAYTDGATLKDGAHLDQSRTGTPTELDQTFAAVNELATALGPEGANRDGTLSKVVANSADNLDGRGAEIRRSIAALSKLSGTADGSKDELFASVEKIERFVSTLEASDSSVRGFNSSLAGVSDVLAAEGDDLQAALRELATALTQIQGYVSENRSALRRNVDGLTEVSETLAKQRQDLDTILKQGPKALTNLAAAYNPTTGTIDTRATIKGSATGKFTVLTQPTYLAGYCGPAREQNPQYAQACYALVEMMEALGAQVPGDAPSGAAGVASAADFARLMGVGA